MDMSVVAVIFQSGILKLFEEFFIKVSSSISFILV